MTIPTTVRMDQDMIARLDGLAQASGRSRAWLIKDALSKYLEYEAWFFQEVEAGRRAAQRGELVSHENVRARMRANGFLAD